MTTRTLIGGNTPNGPRYVHSNTSLNPNWVGRHLKTIIERDGPELALHTILNKGPNGWCFLAHTSKNPRDRQDDTSPFLDVHGYGLAYKRRHRTDRRSLKSALKNPGHVEWAYIINNDGTLTIHKLRENGHHQNWNIHTNAHTR